MTNKHQSNDHGSTQLSEFALLLALLAIAIIVFLPAPQTNVSFAAEDANLNGEPINELADSLPPRIGYTAEETRSKLCRRGESTQRTRAPWYVELATV